MRHHHRPTPWDVAWILAEAFNRIGPRAPELALAVCFLLPAPQRGAAYPYVLDRLRPLLWPIPRTLTDIAAIAEEAWHALPLATRE